MWFQECVRGRGEQPGSPGCGNYYLWLGEGVLEATPEGEMIEAIHLSQFRLKRPAYACQSGRYEEDVQECCEC